MIRNMRKLFCTQQIFQPNTQQLLSLCSLLSLLRLDYSGIALLIMGSFVPWLYYSFYCSPQPRLIYLTIVCVLGIAAIIVAQWDRFSTPRHRPTRAGSRQLRIISTLKKNVVYSLILCSCLL